MTQRQGQGAVPAHGMAADRPRARGRQLRVDQGDQFVRDIGFHAEMRRPGVLGRIDVEARAAAEKRAADDFVAQQRMAFLGIDKKDQKAGLSPAQMRELAQAELVWMQAAERRRSLVQVDEMVELLDLVFGEVRAGLDGLPDWLEREFSLSGEDVERVVAYNDGILRAIKIAIEAAALRERPEVVDPLDRGLI